MAFCRLANMRSNLQAPLEKIASAGRSQRSLLIHVGPQTLSILLFVLITYMQMRQDLTPILWTKTILPVVLFNPLLLLQLVQALLHQIPPLADNLLLKNARLTFFTNLPRWDQRRKPW